MLILLPPSESKANRRRGRPADPSTWSFPELGPTRAKVAAALAEVSRSPEAPALLGVSASLLDEVARNLVLDTAPATPAAEVYTGVLYDALSLATLDTAARRRANRWLVVVSALHGAVRPSDRITAYRLSMGSTLPQLGPLAALWRPALDQVLPGLAARGVVVDCRSAPYAAAWRPGADLAPRWVQVRVPGASHLAKHTRGLVARHLCEVGAQPRTVPALRDVVARAFDVRLEEPAERPLAVGAGRGPRVTAADAVALLERLLPVVVFLLAITVVAEIAERAGVFDVAGHWVAHAGRHRAWALWLLFALLAVGCTVVLSIDTTAVLLTPVGLAVARQVDLDARVFAVTTLWVANTGSLLLPVSNLTNLLALNTFERQGLGHADYVRLAWAPALACILVTLALLALLHRRTLRASYAVDPPADPHDVVLLRWAAAVCLALGPLFALGAPPWAVSLVAAAVLLVVGRWRAPRLLAGLPVPWLMALGFVAVSVVVEVLHQRGLGDLVASVVPQGTGAGALAAVAGTGALVANVANNLPAYLVLEPVAADAAARLMALLVGVNAGPLVTPWASLATLLWLQRCRTAGIRVPWRWLVPAGAACAVLAVAAGVGALAVTA